MNTLTKQVELSNDTEFKDTIVHRSKEFNEIDCLTNNSVEKVECIEAEVIFNITDHILTVSRFDDLISEHYIEHIENDKFFTDFVFEESTNELIIITLQPPDDLTEEYLNQYNDREKAVRIAFNYDDNIDIQPM